MISYIKWIVAALVLLFTKSLGLSSIVLIIFYIFELIGTEENESEQKSGTNNYRYYDSYQSSENNSDIGLIILCAALMNIDRNYAENQYNYIRSFLTKSFDPIHVAKRMTLLDRLLVKQNSIDDACRRVMYYTPIESRYKIIDFLFGLAAADGHVSYQEMITIRQISEILFVDHEIFLRLKEIYYKDKQEERQYRGNSPASYAYIEDYYSTLLIKKEATDQDIKTAYRKLVLQHHPDRWINKSAKEQETARKKFIEVQQAYDKLKSLRGMN